MEFACTLNKTKQYKSTVTDMGFLINNTTQMTFNRVYWAPRAMESAS